MTDVRPTPFRAARGSAVALVGLLMALVAHALAGGEVAPGAPTLLASLVVVAGCVLAAGRAWTVGRVVVALAAVQLVVHGTQWVAGAAGPVDPRLARLATDAPAHRHAADLGLTPTMLVAHLAALSLAAVLLARVDDAVLRLVHLARTVLGLTPVPAVLPSPAQPARLLPRRPARPRSLALLASPRRGPPVVPAPA